MISHEWSPIFVHWYMKSVDREICETIGSNFYNILQYIYLKSVIFLIAVNDREINDWEYIEKLFFSREDEALSINIEY